MHFPHAPHVPKSRITFFAEHWADKPQPATLFTLGNQNTENEIRRKNIIENPGTTSSVPDPIVAGRKMLQSSESLTELESEFLKRTDPMESTKKKKMSRNDVSGLNLTAYEAAELFETGTPSHTGPDTTAQQAG